MSVKISSIIENQFPEFMRQESPLLVEFIKQYYISGEYPGASFDLISNLSNYTKLENLTHLVEGTTLSADISFSDTEIFVESTDGFPDSYGLLRIDSEIITYTSKTETSFVDCVRGFSGISNSQLEFSTSESDSHLNGANVENLSILFLNKFLNKLKKQYIPGFEGREFNADVNQKLFIEKSKDFYSVKGTDKSFEILFGALYGEKVEVIKPRDYLFTPSAAEYRVSKDLVVEAIFGDPLLLENRTLFQDKTDQYPKASGSISKVEKIFRNGSDYYIISLDYDFNKDIDVAGSVFGEFSIHPKTRITKKVIVDSNTISVDSTVGFPSSGNLVLDDSSLVQYESKSLTQFFDCNGILVDLDANESVRVNAFAYGYSGSDKNNIVAVRVTGVIGEFEEIDEAYNLIVGDSIKPKTLGKLSTSVRSKNWIFNIPISYSVKSITLIDAVTSKYQIETVDDNIFTVGDSLNIVLTNGTLIPTDVYSKVNVTNFTVQGQGPLTLSTIDYVEKNISQVSSNNFKNVEIYSANVQNVYEDSNENIFVASPSLPFYFQQPLEVSSRKIVLSGTFLGEILNYKNHGFLTGDVVLYDYPSTDNLGLPKGTYYIRKVNDDSFSLSSSRSNLEAEIYLAVSGTVINNTLEYNDFVGKTLTHQKLIRKIAQPSDRKVIEPTPIGNTGILLNGVEILNYKSQNSVFYGPIDSVDVVSSGDGYDIINPPVIEITDELGSNAKVNPEIIGTLKEIRLLESDLIVSGEPTVTITGGNGSGARVKPEVGLFDHSASFNTGNISNNIIGFATCHNFSNYEKVIFDPDGYSYVSGISTNSEYYVSLVDSQGLKLYRTYGEAVSNSNPISLSVTGFGIHKLVSYEAKPKISSFIVTNPGEGYTNRRISVNSSGISTTTDTINFTRHGFKTGELIVYESYSEAPIVGIQTNISYYATEVDENNFKLSQVADVGVSTSKDFYLRSQQYIDLISSGSGKHFFNYEPIRVNFVGDILNCSNISGIGTSVGIGTSSSNVVRAFKLQPIPPAEDDLITPIYDYVLGYHFNTDYGCKVNAVGIYLPTAASHTIGIWDANDYNISNPFLGDLLWQKQISPSDSCTTIESYCWFDILDGPSIVANRKYVVAATWGADEAVPFKLDNVTVKPSTGFQFGLAANSELPIFSGLLVDFSDPIIAADYTPNSQDNAAIGFLSVNLSLATTSTASTTQTQPTIQILPLVLEEKSYIQPIFRGKINNVFVEDGGQNYGQENIINYNRQPNININSGKDAQLQAIISNGNIAEVLIINSGSEYNSPPDIIINGTGNGAVLTPIINNGELESVIIINPGYGYEQKNTSLTVVNAGSNAELRTNLKSWSINWVERLIQTNQIAADDGIITRGSRSDLGLEYSHGYAPRKFRQMLQSSKYISNNLTYRPDLILDSYNRETFSDSHSPIIGWAYDGNPIYGPYGYEYKTSGTVKLLQSGYELSIKTGRPNTSLYPAGIFVEDYEFTNSGDLDEHNGRYCITPDFPNGTYAYFATISDEGAEINGPFKNYFKPVFPYLIGESYKSKPIDFNFDYYSNQDSLDLNKTGWLRNTTPFMLKSENSFYKYLLSPFSTYDQTSTVTSTLTGSVEGVRVTSGGDGYKVKDKLIFDSKTSGGINATAEVTSIVGKDVSGISVGSTTIFNVEFIPNSTYGVIGFSTLPHNINNGDSISIKNLNHNTSSLQKTFKASVLSQKYTLNQDINVSGITGITTYINLYGNLDFPYLRENDVLQIDNEKVKVLNIDRPTSRLFVERAFGGTAGTYHTVGASISEVPRKFAINAEIQDFNNSFYNKELYFNPSESIGVGLGRTITFSNPGVGPTSVFVPTRSIYIPEHNLKTGEKLTYKLNGGTEIAVSTNGITTSLLRDNTTVYAIKYSNDFVGLSTEKVGVGSTGNFVGYNTTSAAKILYFNVNGTGKKHSIITLYNSTIGQVDKNLVSVFPATSSSLKVGDLVTVSALPSSTKIIKIVYNQPTKRLLANPRNFIGADVDVVNETIKIPNHNYFTGQKVLHTSLVSTTGLSNNTSYYVVVLNSDIISLASSYYNATLDEPIVISFSNASYGTISEVNPTVTVVKNNSAVFDLSDSSLSDSDGFQLFPAFDFDFYTDRQFINKFETTFNGTTFNVTKSGRIGIDLNASVTLDYDETLPNQLYYKLTPRKNKQVFIDTENTAKYNTVNYVDSGYSGTYAVSGVGSTSFTYVVDSAPEVSGYANNVTYTTTSKTATGPINTIKVTSGGSNYRFLPGISSVITDQGKNAIFEVVSTSIGGVNRVNINNIGFDYPADLTLTPLTQTPVVLKIDPQTSLKTISIISPGKNYIFAPSLVLLDGLTLKQVPDVDLRYELGDSEVQIVKNSKGINNVQPIIIPTNNSNAIGISSISFNSTTKDVTLVLSQSYSNLVDFPFVVGDKILVENVSILTDSLARGYNSSSYDYSRFTITSINPNIGGSNGSITYSLANKLSYTEYPGIYNSSISSGSVVPEKFFPQFVVELSKNLFLIDEVVEVEGRKGIVQFWNIDNELLTISTADQFTPGLMIVGADSRSQGKIVTIYDFKSRYNIKSSSIVKKGWNTEKGFLDNEFQKIQDNNYYNSFAYSLKSKVDYQTWNNAVSSLNHIAGFKKFSDLIVESENLIGIGSSETESLSSIIIFNDSQVDLNCIEDYDLVTENNYPIDTKLGSNQIYFNNRILQDYSEAVGNRVITIDNISLSFDGTNRQFPLKSNSNSIFNRSFVGSSSTTVNIASNVLQLENHFFTNGEKLTYSYDVAPIGIKTTSINGIGSTDKLPSTVYVIKYNESTIGFSTTAESALKDIPIPLVLTNVGAGLTHTLTATSQNTRALISLGGIIQSPVVSTASSTKTSSYVGIGSTVISFFNISNFISGDFAQIDSEIVKVVAVGIAATNDVFVQRGWVGTGIATHSINSNVYKVQGDYNIIDSTIHFADPPKGPSPIGTTTGSGEEVDFTGITTTLDFNGRAFMRSGAKNSAVDAYSTNFLFDDISNDFNGISSSFTLKSNYQNITGFSQNNGALLINEVFQAPSDFTGSYKTYGSYTLEQSSGITSIRFLGAPATQTYDVNGSGLPIGGVIVSVGYSQGFGLQPLVAAGGTAVVSTAGTIRSISIGNSGSGYRRGLQTVNVGLYVSTTGISTFQNIGIASILNGQVVSVAITNPGLGYTSTRPPVVKFDDPLPYVDLPLQYLSPSSGIGTGGKVKINVGLGLSVINLEVTNRGFGYKKGDILTVSLGGTVGIPTISSPSYNTFRVSVDEIYNNKFAGWTFGELQIIDSIESLFDGIRKSFPIKIDNELRSIRARYGSPIDIESTLLIFVNGILQIPGDGYTFTGSSFIKFTEAPKEGYSCVVLFYRGTGSVDVVDVDVLETIKPGDIVKLNDDFGYSENERIVTNVNSSDSINTISYSGPGVSNDDAYTRPVKWCRQTEDLFIDQKEVTKNREIYEPIIEPSTNIIKTVGITSTTIFVENIRTFFDDQRENSVPDYRNKFKIITQDEIRPAISTATVSIAGTIQTVTILDGGKGYTSPPIVSFSTPIGLTTASRAYATATVTAGSISSITIISPGTGYTGTMPPQVMVSNPSSAFEDVTASAIEGDFGIVTGVAITSVGVASTGLVFNLYIPQESALRNSSIVGSAITISGIQTGHYFVLKNSFIGNGFVSLDENGSIISIGSSFIDNVYRVARVSIAQTFVAGIGTTTVSRVTVSLTNNSISGIGFTNIYGTYSWGRITVAQRSTTNAFTVYNNGVTGISTSPIVKRVNPLKFKNYT